jgi:hypothetical protein
MTPFPTLPGVLSVFLMTVKSKKHTTYKKVQGGCRMFGECNQVGYNGSNARASGKSICQRHFIIR